MALVKTIVPLGPNEVAPEQVLAHTKKIILNSTVCIAEGIITSLAFIIAHRRQCLTR
jgi:hypothetical protein